MWRSIGGVVVFSLLAAVAASIALLPSIPFQLEPMIEFDAPDSVGRDVTLAQYAFRKDIVVQYFSWAVLSITLAGFILVRFAQRVEAAKSTYLIVTSVFASIASVIVGVVQLEVLAELLQQQTLPNSWIGPMSALPATQLGLLVYAAFAAFVALLACMTWSGASRD